MKRKKIKTLVDAKQRLASVTNDIEVLTYRGTTTSHACFFNKETGKPFVSTLNDVIKRLNKGDSIRSFGQKQHCNVGKGSKRNLKLDLEKWLLAHIPHIELTHWSGDYSSKCTFYRKDTNSYFYLEPNRLKDKYRRGLQICPTKEEVTQRRFYTRVSKGDYKLVHGKPMQAWADSLGVSYSLFQSTVKHKGEQEALTLISTDKSFLEAKIEAFLKEVKINYKFNKKLHPYNHRPDFFLPDYRVVIECDGLYWHSDAVKEDKFYHYNKRQDYKKLGLTPLFFYSDEIENRFEIVKSMILHRCGLLFKTLGARNTKCVPLTITDFFEENHLMGKGQGHAYGLVYNGEIVAGMQVIKKKDYLDLSRFCTASYVSVPGSYSKLIKHILSLYNFDKVSTFVDLRYGSGSYLIALGYSLANNPVPSFYWTDGTKRFHRMKYPGNSGYDKGLFKVWDCGQARYISYIKR